MTTSEIIALVLLLLTAINVGLTAASYRRANAWKEGEEAKDLINRVLACERAVDGSSGNGAAISDLAGRVASAEGKIEGLGARMENVATKADMSRVTAEVNGLERLVQTEVAGITRHIKSVEGGVDRIESHLMNLNAQRGHA